LRCGRAYAASDRTRTGSARTTTAFNGIEHCHRTRKTDFKNRPSEATDSENGFPAPSAAVAIRLRLALTILCLHRRATLKLLAPQRNNLLARRDRAVLYITTPSYNKSLNVRNPELVRRTSRAMDVRATVSGDVGEITWLCRE